MKRLVFIVAAAWSASAYADAFDCKPTETQAECFTRLKCKPDEELEACQKRLRSQGQGQGNQGQQQNNQGNGGDRGNRDNGGDRGGDRDRDRGGDRDRDRDRGGDRGDYDRNRGGSRYDEGGGGRRRRAAGGSGGGFVANKKFGLGLELGEPTGLNGKVFISDKSAIDFGVGYMYDGYYYGDGLHLYGDYLYHAASLASNPTLELPFYIGVGLRYWEFDYCQARVCTYAGNAFGIRVPLGIAFDFNNVPLDIFLQAVPVLDFLGGDYYRYYGNREHFGVDFSAGFRFWFK